MIDVITVAKKLKSNYEGESNISISGNFRLGDIRDNHADIFKIKKLLGYTPKVNFDKGINLFTDWVNEQEIKNDMFENSILEMKEKGLLK